MTIPAIDFLSMVRYASLVTSADKGAVLQAPEEKK